MGSKSGIFPHCSANGDPSRLLGARFGSTQALCLAQSFTKLNIGTILDPHSKRVYGWLKHEAGGRNPTIFGPVHWLVKNNYSQRDSQQRVVFLQVFNLVLGLLSLKAMTVLPLT